jgi:hypothetical protein
MSPLKRYDVHTRFIELQAEQLESIYQRGSLPTFRGSPEKMSRAPGNRNSACQQIFVHVIGSPAASYIGAQPAQVRAKEPMNQYRYFGTKRFVRLLYRVETVPWSHFLIQVGQCAVMSEWLYTEVRSTAPTSNSVFRSSPHFLGSTVKTCSQPLLYRLLNPWLTSNRPFFPHRPAVA